MATDVKIFHYQDGSVRITTADQIAYFTREEWEVIDRYCKVDIEAALNAEPPREVRDGKW